MAFMAADSRSGEPSGRSQAALAVEVAAARKHGLRCEDPAAKHRASEDEGRGSAAFESSGGGTRTHNLRVNSAPLCRLSYPGPNAPPASIGRIGIQA
jgi:hypothetical protein